MRGVVVLILLADAGAASRGLDPHNCGPVRVLSPLAGDLLAVAFSPDGRLCAVGGTAGVVRVYDTARWQETREIASGGKVSGLVFLPDGRRLIAADEVSLRVLDAEEGKAAGRFQKHQGPVRSVSASPDGQTLLSVHDAGRAAFWALEGNAAVPVPEERWTAAAFSRSGDRAALGGVGVVQIRIRKDAGWVEGRGFGFDGDRVGVLSFSKDGRRLLGGGGNGAVTVWDVETGAPERALQGHGNAVRALAVTPDDMLAVSASDDGTIRIWDWRKGAELSQLKHPGVQALAIHPSGRLLASVGTDRQLRVWGYVRGGEARARGKGFCGVSFQKSGGAVIIFSLVPGGPAEAAGLQVGDAVRLIGTRGIREPSEALEAIGAYGEGEEAVFEIERKGEERQVRVRMGKKPGAKEKAP